ncbi:phosphate ABC transporter substrate-binding protein PstS family protein [Papillibacter cinnamivorans]|uniref:Phosphate-binding protein n=1 Tax=Papillibacter cinnamivorans DSM 12816 TaxID=1122930 RepID=A0A1W1YPP6_9FIRM|nr:phosphate ABC transporter substrate-binding protein PstS family protein [Papillibacter cinnamivorans]SMC37781.1 phosphate binding protein [Papillibacter cinnamivorans DSM 12816]
MKLIKRILPMFLAVMLFTAMIPAASAATTISIKIDGQTVSSDTAPYVENGTTLVPVRVITEYLGADVSWVQAKQQAVVKTAGYTVVFTLGSKNYTVNGVTKTLLLAPRAVNQRTMIPLRALSEAIGADVDYDAATKTAVVNYFTTMTGSIKISGSTTLQPIAQAAADKLLSMNTGLSIAVSGGGSSAGIKDTINGANNVGMSSRVLTADESASLTQFTVANDGIALIVNPNNTVKNLTKEQAEKIFLGEITNWKDVGGNDAPILVQTRETGSGTLATLSELLLEKAAVVSTATPYASSALIKQAVASDVNAIGFDSIGYVDSSVKVVSIGNITPTTETVKSGAYLLSRSLYVFTKGTPEGVNAKFIDFLKSESCQKDIVVKEGYIAIR